MAAETLLSLDDPTPVPVLSPNRPTSPSIKRRYSPVGNLPTRERSPLTRKSFRMLLRENRNYRKLTEAEDVFAQVAIETADSLPLTAPSLTTNDLRALLFSSLGEVYSPDTIAVRYGITLTLIERNKRLLQDVDPLWRTVYRRMHRERLQERVGLGTTKQSWFEHMVAIAQKKIGFGISARELSREIPLRYFPQGTTEYARQQRIHEALLSSTPPEIKGVYGFREYISMLRTKQPNRFAGIFDTTNEAIQQRRDRGIAILQVAPGTLTYDERISLLIGDLLLHHQHNWPQHFTTGALVHQSQALGLLRPWMVRYQMAWMKDNSHEQPTANLWKDDTNLVRRRTG